ncbi:release factor glutamine methyltransferase [Breznakia sp. PF5-3]|uniref:peptide chain release factor N(5)-glutamine methyltransferase n=1 Tax=unclassified Breznakia TaxID=2623764 RepID=UPI0024057008|nr:MULTISPECIES: peptide chain release factor N(5)-glutamine methyltransferase [unclassified Breznakia]MDF9824931.1 release factor glutamine methyltransferase [Breznakia sp. PM6-1]MDF9835801.1 release factor glutamine methyltransferase [Breznakia sp. PF5-3]
MKYKVALKEAQKKCMEAGIGEQAPFFLLLELSNKEAHNLYMEYEEEMEDCLLQEYLQKVERLLTHEPLDHILGYSYFYGYQFLVNEDVLIPRPETEELVAHILSAYDDYFPNEEVQVIDVGTGSGAIAIALKLEEKKLQVAASDISVEAVEMAKKNADKLDANVAFMVGNMLDPFIEQGLKTDILISNPPYIPKAEVMEESVVNFEPHVALFGGDDGLKFYHEIFKNAHKVLKEKSFLAFEIGYDQKVALKALAKEYFVDAKIEVYQDINGKDRMLFIYNNIKIQ